jgi:hypothetical protein
MHLTPSRKALLYTLINPEMQARKRSQKEALAALLRLRASVDAAIAATERELFQLDEAIRVADKLDTAH